MRVHENIAKALIGVLERGETDPLFELLAPGSVVWHNHDRRVIDARENVEGSVRLRELVDDVKVEVVDQQDTPTGFVQQFVLRGIIKGTGTELVTHNCLIARVEDGRLSRVDEYVDPALITTFG
ncbi:MAG: hypothetical protein JRG86_17000 [Deltaproteobacteria bacterium]|jgi:ketosteroid isomerase-like protein|nr:hypothetical protein [Deltaproteobacteria bacterium]MBW2498160.1 hypothetical protein [Deltaproteobacteria bacterium]